MFILKVTLVNPLAVAFFSAKSDYIEAKDYDELVSIYTNLRETYADHVEIVIYSVGSIFELPKEIDEGIKERREKQAYIDSKLKRLGVHELLFVKPVSFEEMYQAVLKIPEPEETIKS